MKYSLPLRKLLERLDTIPDGSLHAGHRHVQAHITALTQAVESLEKVAQHPDPTETEARHAQRVAEAAKKLLKRADKIAEHLTVDIQEATQTLSDALTEKAGLRENAYASEIRAAMRGMGKRERAQVLQQAVEDGDGATVAALTSAPTVVTGLDATYAERMADAFTRKHAPEVVNARDSLMENYSTALQAVSLAKSASDAAVDAEFIREIQQAQDQARDAQEAFDNATA